MNFYLSNLISNNSSPTFPLNTECFIPQKKPFSFSHFSCHCICSASFQNRHPSFIQILFELPSSWSSIIFCMKLCLDLHSCKIRCSFYDSTILGLLKTWFAFNIQLTIVPNYYYVSQPDVPSTYTHYHNITPSYKLGELWYSVIGHHHLTDVRGGIQAL